SVEGAQQRDWSEGPETTKVAWSQKGKKDETTTAATNKSVHPRCERDKRRNPREIRTGFPSPLRPSKHPKETAVYILPSLLLYSSSRQLPTLLPKANTHSHTTPQVCITEGEENC
ncbi:hypothetical protein H113_07934, partial [Trichophyton rubrum MR1459]